MDVVFDTGSDWLVLDGSQCETCTGYNRYDGATGSKLSDKQVSRFYHQKSLKLTGNIYQDSVCIALGKMICMKDFNYILVSEQTSLNSDIANQVFQSVAADGFLGLSRKNMDTEIGHLNTKETTKLRQSPLFIKSLTDQGRIQQQTFAFYLSSNPEISSFVDLGGFLAENIKNKAYQEILWIRMSKKGDVRFWSAHIQAISFGSPRYDNSFAIQQRENLVIFNTGSSGLHLPKHLWQSFVEQLLKFS